MDESFRIGTWRKSMDSNPLLQRAPLGRCLERGHTLPPGGVTYGKANYKTDSGTAGALKYSPLNERIKSAAPLELEKDFIKLNRIGVRQGVLTAQDQKNFRAQHDIRLPPPAREIRTRNCPPPDIVFGRPSRPRSPIYDVIEHKFQRNWLLQQKARDEAREQRIADETKKAKTVQLNSLVLKRNNATRQTVEEGPLWQMPRFQKQHATVQSFRSDLERERSFAAYRNTEATRLGKLISKVGPCTRADTRSLLEFVHNLHIT